jgi:hypothetical protein
MLSKKKSVVMFQQWRALTRSKDMRLMDEVISMMKSFFKSDPKQDALVRPDGPFG